MSQPATAITGNEIFNFVSIFTNESKNIRIPQDRQENVRHAFVNWINATGFLSIIHASTLSAGKIFQIDRLILVFSLSELYRDKFALLRGLLEFSRPKEIILSSNRLDHTFQLQISVDHVNSIKEYLETILSLLAAEIRFKTSLRAVIDFENRVRQEQEKIYKAFRAVQ